MAFLRENLSRFIPVGRVVLPVTGMIDCFFLYVRFSEAHVWSLMQILIYLVIRPIQVLGINFLVFYADKIPSKYHVVLGTLLLWSYRIFIIYFMTQDLDHKSRHHAHLLVHTIWTPIGAAVLLPTFEEHILGALAIVAVKPAVLVAEAKCFDGVFLIELGVRVVIACVGIYLNYGVHGRRREYWISSSRYNNCVRIHLLLRLRQ